MAKAKWLEESSNSQLLAIIRKSFEEEASKAAINKAEKATIELEERTPEGDPSVPEVLEALRKNVDALAKAYEQEVEALVEDDEVEDDEVEDDEEDEDDDEEEEEDVIETKYDGMTLKALKTEARTRGIRVTNKMKKEDLVEILQDDDEEIWK